MGVLRAALGFLHPQQGAAHRSYAVGYRHCPFHHLARGCAGQPSIPSFTPRCDRSLSIPSSSSELRSPIGDSFIQTGDASGGAEIPYSKPGVHSATGGFIIQVRDAAHRSYTVGYRHPGISLSRLLMRFPQGIPSFSLGGTSATIDSLIQAGGAISHLGCFHSG